MKVILVTNVVLPLYKIGIIGDGNHSKEYKKF